MEHIAAVLLLIGCSDNLAECRELPAPTAIYETAEECEGDLRPSLSSVAGSYPQIFGQCVAVDPAMEEEDAELVWEVRPDGTLYAVIESTDSIMVSSVEGAEVD